MSVIGPSELTSGARADQGVSRLMLISGILTIIGLIAAGYMSYTSLTSTHLVCGGLGDCSAVQSSIYAKLAGVPVSVLGFASYAVIALLLVGRLWLPGAAGYIAGLGVLAVALSGMVFSVFLTYVELNIIQAVCPWCLASAAVITLLTIVSLVRVWDEVSSA